MARILTAALCAGLHAMALFSLDAAEPARAESVSLAVRFKLTNLDYQPIEGANVRLVLDSMGAWQSSTAGQRFTTDAKGEYRFETTVRLEARSRKRPTNFMDSLLSRPQPTEFLPVAAELDYAGHRWLYMIDLHRFQRDGDMLLDGGAVYCADARGDFTQRAKFTDGNWMMADLGGLALSTPGHEAWEFMLKPDEMDATKRRWTLDLAFKALAEPGAAVMEKQLMIIVNPVSERSAIAGLCPDLRGLLNAELAAGNSVVECRSGLYSQDALLVLLAKTFRCDSKSLPKSVEYREVNDPHWWKAEYFHPATKHCIACRF